MLYKMDLPGFFTVEMTHMPEIHVLTIIRGNNHLPFIFDCDSTAAEFLTRYVAANWHKLNTTKKITDFSISREIDFYFEHSDEEYTWYGRTIVTAETVGEIPIPQ